MAAWTLTTTAWDALDELRFTTTDKRLFRNATIILMSAVGRTKVSIAQDMGCSPSTVDLIRRAYRHRGVDGLQPGKPSGRKSRATPEYRRVLRETVMASPTSWGYGFSVWSLARLGAHLKKQTGIEFSEDQLGRVMKEEKFTFQRPKHTLKGKRDEVAYEAAREELDILKKKPWQMMPTRS